MLTYSFKTFALFVVLLVLPTIVYFYAFHGDWFLLYSFDSRRIPSAVALVVLVAISGVAMAGFSLGAMLARNQRTGAGYSLVGGSALLAVAVVLIWHRRLSVVGTFAQYRGDFGLRDYGGPLLQAGLLMGAILLLGTAYLMVRIRMARRRS